MAATPFEADRSDTLYAKALVQSDIFRRNHRKSVRRTLSPYGLFSQLFFTVSAMFYRTVKPLVLASSSPRRKQYLDDLGLRFSIYAEDIDETPFPAENPEQYVQRMAREKAAAVSRRFPDCYVLAADTAVCLGETILGKPVNQQEAVSMLCRLSGTMHLVRSAIAVVCTAADCEMVTSCVTEVRFSAFTVDTARAYVAAGESLDKAGGYGIQGKGAFLVERVNGSYTNVVGLPLAETISLLEHLGVVRPTGLG